jgi:hypothetical protein
VPGTSGLSKFRVFAKVEPSHVLPDVPNTYTLAAGAKTATLHNPKIRFLLDQLCGVSSLLRAYYIVLEELDLSL